MGCRGIGFSKALSAPIPQKKRTFTTKKRFLNFYQIVVNYAMDNKLAKKKPAKVLAIECFALNPTITAKEVAAQVGVSPRTIASWKEDPMFIDKIYERYMTEFGSQLPAVINSMVREAKHGNVQAARLVLEHSGRLVKNVNITIDSPFEKFLKKETIEDAEVIEVFDEVEMPQDLPERKEHKTVKEEKIKIKTIMDREKKKLTYNDKRKEWYNWKKRAKAVGIDPLPAKKPTKGQRKEWEQSIIEAEKLL